MDVFFTKVLVIYFFGGLSARKIREGFDQLIIHKVTVIAQPKTPVTKNV